MSDAKSIGTRSIGAVFWGAGGAVFRILLQFGSQVVLARILGPEQYGLFAIGAVVVSFSGFFSDIGIAYGLIQKKSVSAQDLRFVLTWQVILGVTVTTAIILAARPIAGFFGDEHATGIVQALAVVCLLNALAAPSLNLLKRELDFRRIQLAQIASFIIGYILVGIPLALAGVQVWALVAAWLIQSTLVLLMLYVATRHPIKPLFWYDEAKSVSSFGLTVLLTNLVNWVINNIDRVIVGHVFASRQMGLYATTFNMLYTPTTSLLGVVQPVFFSASARVADNQPRIAEGYRALIGAVAVFVLPVFVCVSAISETFVLALYGPKWHDAAVIFQPLALAMPLFLIWGLTTPLLWNGGFAGREFRVQLPVALVWIAACWFAAQHSVVLVAWVVFGLFFLRCLVIIGTAVRLLELEVKSLWAAVRGGFVLSFALALAVWTVDASLPGLVPWLRLAADALCGLLCLLAALRFFPGVVGEDLAALLGRILGRCPPAIAAQFAFFNTQGGEP